MDAPHLLALTVLLASLDVVPKHAQAQAIATRVVTGVVRGSITGQPAASADVHVVRHVSALARTSKDGRFVIRNVPTGAVTLWAGVYGQRGLLDIPAGADSIDVVLVVVEPRPRSAVSDTFPALTPDEQRAIWAALFGGLRRASANAQAHLDELSRMIGMPLEQPASSAPNVVLLLTPASPSALRDVSWQDSLNRAGILAAVCTASTATQCPQRGFQLFVAPSPPGRFAADSVTVPVAFTAIDPDACRRGHAAGDQGNDAHYVVRFGIEWRYDGPDDTGSYHIGGLYCGTP